jgi:uncharacterized protein
MNIAWTHFTPLASLCGGLLIGLSACALLLLMGRIAGISGIVGGLLPRGKTALSDWRAAFVLGLILAPVLYQVFADLPASHIDSGWSTLILAGLLVGYGTRLGSGCTSGHGICGLANLSPRSLVATITFMTTGFLTVYVVRHLIA